MLAGYLPFDDDPANPEGDNINLLYKYIVSTPLTFPEYVTPHARDLLRRIAAGHCAVCGRGRPELEARACPSLLSRRRDDAGLFSRATAARQWCSIDPAALGCADEAAIPGLLVAGAIRLVRAMLCRDRQR